MPTRIADAGVGGMLHDQPGPLEPRGFGPLAHAHGSSHSATKGGAALEAKRERKRAQTQGRGLQHFIPSILTKHAPNFLLSMS